MIKKGLRHAVSPRTIAIGFVFLLFIVLCKYLIYSHCKQGHLCSFMPAANLSNVYPDVSTTYVATMDLMQNNISSKIFNVDVNVNFREHFIGMNIENELYVPFHFLKDYYEIDGYFDSVEANQLPKKKNFVWLHTSKSALDPRNLHFRTYSPFGKYLNFQESDVANRARVKCICGKHEVPITTQWDPKGYYYPTQIAQYGLSHLSKHLAEDVPVKEWKLKIRKDTFGRFSLPLSIKEQKLIKVKFVKKPSSFSVKVIASDKNRYIIHYTTDNLMVALNGKTITHGLGEKLRKKEVVRDLSVDLVKGLSFREGKRQGVTANISIKKIFEILFFNVEYVASVKFTNVDHVSMFTAAADWFINFQDSNGGWKTNVSRVVFKGMKREAGWYSSMGQGQAISLLSRVYKYTTKLKYLHAALKATQVFHIPSNEEGVVAFLFGKYPWYEEYPTTPPLYVLNGFIYSLFGLYDLYRSTSSSAGKEAYKLFRQGVASLEALLPLFDNGHGSFYDLRHISVPGHPPNIARWQYHKVHLQQLYAIADITKSKIVNRTLSRWIGYASGIRAKHN